MSISQKRKTGGVHTATNIKWQACLCSDVQGFQGVASRLFEAPSKTRPVLDRVDGAMPSRQNRPRRPLRPGSARLPETASHRASANGLQRSVPWPRRAAGGMQTSALLQPATGITAERIHSATAALHPHHGGGEERAATALGTAQRSGPPVHLGYYHW